MLCVGLSLPLHSFMLPCPSVCFYYFFPFHTNSSSILFYSLISILLPTYLPSILSYPLYLSLLPVGGRAAVCKTCSIAVKPSSKPHSLSLLSDFSLFGLQSLSLYLTTSHLSRFWFSFVSAICHPGHATPHCDQYWCHPHCSRCHSSSWSPQAGGRASAHHKTGAPS